MTWNYRIMRHQTALGVMFALHEVYYTESGEVSAWTEKAVGPYCHSRNEVIEDLEMKLRDAKRHPVIDCPEE